MLDGFNLAKPRPWVILVNVTGLLRLKYIIWMHHHGLTETLGHLWHRRVKRSYATLYHVYGLGCCFAYIRLYPGVGICC